MKAIYETYSLTLWGKCKDGSAFLSVANFDSEFGRAVKNMCDRFNFGATHEFKDYGLVVKVVDVSDKNVEIARERMTALAKRWEGKRGLTFN